MPKKTKVQQLSPRSKGKSRLAHLRKEIRKNPPTAGGEGLPPYRAKPKAKGTTPPRYSTYKKKAGSKR